MFRLRGVDVYRVLDCQPLGVTIGGPRPEPAADLLMKLADYSAHLAGCRDLETLFATSLERLATTFDYRYSFVMLRDEEGKRLFTVASHGFAASGVGSEVAIGEGLIGTAAERRMPVRSTNLARERVLQRAVRDELARSGDAGRLEEEIPLPGLPDAQSQIVLPLEARGELLGVLVLQSDRAGRYLAGDEPKMQIVARQLAASMAVLESAARVADPAPAAAAVTREFGDRSAATVRYYPADDSIFVDDEYLIKGLPGRILHWMLEVYPEQQRSEFTNKEIRLDPTLKLPEYHDNLEARLILLRQRLEERCDCLRLERVARGRLRLSVSRPVRMRVEAR